MPTMHIWLVLIAFAVDHVGAFQSLRLCSHRLSSVRVISRPVRCDRDKHNEVDLYNKHASLPDQDIEFESISEDDSVSGELVDGEGNSEASFSSLANRLYSSMFFYGLDVPQLSPQVRRLRNEQSYSTLTDSKEKGSPFLTPSEHRALQMLRLSNRLPKTSQTQTQPSPPKYDPNNSESVDEYIKSLQSTIGELETALGLARVNLAAEEDSERKAELVKQLHSNQRQLENAKVELVTAKASTMNGSDEG